MLAKNQGPGQQKSGEEGKDFSQTKPGQPAQAAEQVEPHKDQQLNRNVFFSKLAAVESQAKSGVITVDRERRKATEVAAVSSRAMLLAT